MVNKTNVLHGIIAVLINLLAVLVLWLMGENIALAFFTAPLIFFGREHRDAEIALYDGVPPLSISLKALNMSAWNTDTFWDFIVPCAVSLVMFTVFFIMGDLI